MRSWITALQLLMLMKNINKMLMKTKLIFKGEELAFTDVHISWEETVDPQGCNTNENDYEAASRDPARTPFQWDDTNLAGKFY